MGMTDGTAVNGPLFVVPDLKEGQLFYNTYLEAVPSEDSDEEPPALEARPFPHPVAHFPLPLRCRDFAVSGGGTTILGLSAYSRDTFVHDAAATRSAVVPGPQLRDPKARLALLPVGDDTVLVMDQILRMSWPGDDSFCSFEALRRVPSAAAGGGSWRAAPLPEPPIGYGSLSFVTAYVAMGRNTAWVSVGGRGTFSLDIERGAWREEGSWELPLRGRAFHVPELGAVFGLSAVGGRCLCACYVVDEARPRPALVSLWSETFPSGECRERGQKLWWDMSSLAYLGEGRFCISRHVVVERTPEGRAARYAISCMTVEVRRRLPGGELHLAKCGKLRYLGVWPYEDYPFPYFIQQ